MLGDRDVIDTSTKDLNSLATAIETELQEGGIPPGELAQLDQEQAEILEELRQRG